MIRIFLIVTLLLTAALPPDSFSHAEPQQKTARARKQKSKGNSTAKSGKKSAAPIAQTSAEVKKQEEAARKEIKQTEEKIKENENSVKRGLNELGKLEGEINVSKKKVSELTAKINSLNAQIASLEGNISTNEAELEKLRREYLKAVKKMRVTKKNNSDLAFIFSSSNFNQALRRMRYLKQFSEWRDRQSLAIDEKLMQLKEEKSALSLAKENQDKALDAQRSSQDRLEQQYKRQDEIVAELKKNGAALQSHLSKKQSEANDLRNKVSALIAEEQRKAEAERKAAEERARLEASKNAEQERMAADEVAKKEAQLLANNEGKDSKKKEKTNNNKENKKNGKVASKDNKSGSQQGAPATYADARKREPRSKSEDKVKEATVSVAGNSFASMKGKLPYPASGSFKVTSRFGQQTLPDLPDVVYDNPGIDAEVNAGSSALAVFNGNVSGVYIIPGYNTVVIVNHGNYYTVYGNISGPVVKVGDNVRAGQTLGTLALDEDDSRHSMIHFEVWRNREKLNPLDWLH